MFCLNCGKEWTTTVHFCEGKTNMDYYEVEKAHTEAIEEWARWEGEAKELRRQIEAIREVIKPISFALESQWPYGDNLLYVNLSINLGNLRRLVEVVKKVKD